MLQLVAFVPLVLLPLRSVFDARQLGYVINLFMLGQSLLITVVCSPSPCAGLGGHRAGGGAGDRRLVVQPGDDRRREPDQLGLPSAILRTPTTPETRGARNLRRRDALAQPQRPGQPAER